MKIYLFFNDPLIYHLKVWNYFKQTFLDKMYKNVEVLLADIFQLSNFELFVAGLFLTFIENEL